MSCYICYCSFQHTQPNGPGCSSSMWMSWFCPADLLAPCSGTNGAFICFYDETHFCGCLMWVVTCGGSFSTFHIFQDPSLFSFSQETVAFQFARHPIFPILSCQVGHFSDSRYSERPGKAIVLPECFFGQLTAIKTLSIHPWVVIHACNVPDKSRQNNSHSIS